MAAMLIGKLHGSGGHNLPLHLLLALVLMARKAACPQALMKPYRKEKR